MHNQILRGGLMTEIGKQLIQEFINETNEKLEDDKKRIFFVQGFTSIKEIFVYWLNLLFKLGLLCFLFLLIISFLFLDIQTIEKIRNSTNSEILEFFKSWTAVWFCLTIFVCFMTPIFTVMIGKRLFTNKIEERKYLDQREIILANRMVEIQEELMVRHGLIGGDHGEK